MDYTTNKSIVDFFIKDFKNYSQKINLNNGGDMKANYKYLVISEKGIYVCETMEEVNHKLKALKIINTTYKVYDLVQNNNY